jgi:small-conductance mechanosensitive channel
MSVVQVGFFLVGQTDIRLLYRMLASTSCHPHGVWSRIIVFFILTWHGACARYLMFSLPPMLTRAAPSLWTHISMFHRNLTRSWDMLMSLLKRSTVALAAAMMLAILAISPHTSLLFSDSCIALLCSWYHHSSMTNIIANHI